MNNEEVAKVLISRKRESKHFRELMDISDPELDILAFASIRNTITKRACEVNTGWSFPKISVSLGHLTKRNYLASYSDNRSNGEVKHYRITGVGRRMVNQYLASCRP